MTHSSKLESLAKRMQILRPRDLIPHGIPRQYLGILENRNILRKVGRGLYVYHAIQETEQHSMAQVAKLVPNCVFSLLTALRYHGLTTQAPFEIWIAIERRSWKPRLTYPPLRIIQVSEPAYSFGICEEIVEGVRIRVYDPAKTVADCFKYRNKIGLDVAIEALRDSLRTKKATFDQLWAAAQICRVSNVIRPYLESLG